MDNPASIFILFFLAITFIQSSYDKFTDWKGNISWLQEHFDKTFLAKNIVIALRIVIILEIITSVLCVVGIIEISISGGTQFGLYGSSVSCVTLLLLLVGQRIAKDYEGAKNIIIYFIPAVMAVYWLS